MHRGSHSTYEMLFSRAWALRSYGTFNLRSASTVVARRAQLESQHTVTVTLRPLYGPLFNHKTEQETAYLGR